MNRINSAMSYISSRQGPQTTTEESLFKQAEDMAREVNQKTDAWTEDEWQKFTNEMQTFEIEMFKLK